MRHQAAARFDVVAARAAGEFGLGVAELPVEQAPATQRLEQLFLFLFADRGVELALMRRLAEQFCDMPVEIRAHMTNALRLAAESLGRVQVGVDVDLIERLERHLEPFGVVEHRVVMIGNAPRSGVDIQTRVELATLLEAAEFGVLIAAAQRPRAPARAMVVLEHLDLVAGAAQFIRCDESGDAGTEDQDRGIARCAVEFDRSAKIRFGRVTERGHALIHGGSAGKRADALEQIATTERSTTRLALHASSPRCQPQRTYHEIHCASTARDLPMLAVIWG